MQKKEPKQMSEERTNPKKLMRMIMWISKRYGVEDNNE